MERKIEKIDLKNFILENSKDLFLTLCFTSSLINLIPKEIETPFYFFPEYHSLLKSKIEKVEKYFDYNKNGKIDLGLEMNDLEKTIGINKDSLKDQDNLEVHELVAYEILFQAGKIK